MQAGKTQIVSAGPGHRCLECQGVYAQEEATIARESASWGDTSILGRLETTPIKWKLVLRALFATMLW